MFTIKEPVRGVREAFINDFLLEQEQYGAVSGEVILGDIWYAQLIIQRRK
jgi:hypothetical protein